ncbi:formylglycine-generating enzyme family protein [uncultured Maribacter sp.]|uniref:formylglycine-generating enzyme family protein n=1 Tax=uncultured Maribacter sp. TaxID=431308 RepID=UPI002627EAC3|nr:formylglycine-generating enzyme family protein [uncultured Maribacter sp.]
MKNQLWAVFLFGTLVISFCVQCKDTSVKTEKKKEATVENKTVTEKIIKLKDSLITDKPVGVEVPEGMVWISGDEFFQGAVSQDKIAMEHEKPAYKVAVNGFFISTTEVTNDQFAKFVKETQYVTVSERTIDWEEMKKQLPEGTQKPHDSILQPGSLTFKKSEKELPNLYDFSQWWRWTIGANWRHPNGPKSSIKGKGDYPVVQIAYEDALAYCEWEGSRLPTEAEWELAARGKNKNTIYYWGDDASNLNTRANTWEGKFPLNNTKLDGYEKRAPVKSYPPNSNGLYDMAGNVWEWTSDWYNTNYYKEVNKDAVVFNPTGASKPYTQNNPYTKEKIMKGGSFLCSESYCASYRVSSRMGSSLDSSLEHLGFRTVKDVGMVK